MACIPFFIIVLAGVICYCSFCCCNCPPPPRVIVYLVSRMHCNSTSNYNWKHMRLYIPWQNKDLASPRVPRESTDHGFGGGQWDDSRSSRNTWPLKPVHTTDCPEPKRFRNLSDQKGIAWFWRVGENCESFLVFRSLWVMVSLHVVLWCTSDLWVEFAHSNLPCFGSIYICRKTR